MKKIAVSIVTVILAVTLGACASSTNDEGAVQPEQGRGSVSSSVNVFEVELPDGQTVLCVSEKRDRSGGLSCDWDNAK